MQLVMPANFQLYLQYPIRPTCQLYLVMPSLTVICLCNASGELNDLFNEISKIEVTPLGKESLAKQIAPLDPGAFHV